LTDATETWREQWKKTPALQIFETPGEFKGPPNSPDVRKPKVGLPEINRRLLDILSGTTNQDIVDIESAHTRGEKNFVPHRMRPLVQKDKGHVYIHTAVIQLGSYVNCFVIADENMDSLYVNFQMCNVPNKNHNIDLDKGTYSLLCQLSPATRGSGAIPMIFCALDDQSVFKIIYTMSYMASKYLKWGEVSCTQDRDIPEGELERRLIALRTMGGSVAPQTEQQTTEPQTEQQTTEQQTTEPQTEQQTTEQQTTEPQTEQQTTEQQTTEQQTTEQQTREQQTREQQTREQQTREQVAMDGCRSSPELTSSIGELARRKVYVTGYSVGGALASLFTLFYSEIRYADPASCGNIPYFPTSILPPTTILATYGAPPCGTDRSNTWDTQSVNRKMQNYINGGAVVLRRYVTQGDPIPMLIPDDTETKILYTHMGNCCGTSVVRCPGALNLFDGFLETLSDGIEGIPLHELSRGLQLFSTTKYDVRNNEIDAYGCRPWFVSKVDDPRRIKKPDQHADQCGIRFFIPLLTLHLGASDGTAKGRDEAHDSIPLERKQVDCHIYVPYITQDRLLGNQYLRKLPLYTSEFPNPGDYCEFIEAIKAAQEASSDDMDRVINAAYYDVLQNWGSMDKSGLQELKLKIANAVWGGQIGSIRTGYRSQSVQGAVLATISFEQMLGCTQRPDNAPDNGPDNASDNASDNATNNTTDDDAPEDDAQSPVVESPAVESPAVESLAVESPAPARAVESPAPARAVESPAPARVVLPPARVVESPAVQEEAPAVQEESPAAHEEAQEEAQEEAPVEDIAPTSANTSASMELESRKQQEMLDRIKSVTDRYNPLKPQTDPVTNARRTRRAINKANLAEKRAINKANQAAKRATRAAKRAK
jgi:hypothetical protein